ncbi:hypothetical protein BZA77DRAFT_343025 [Pyronema omphalodes]|nr:hypothetical protein BZA77DRAFT_343025 [Pyronema omphalodes]
MRPNGVLSLLVAGAQSISTRRLLTFLTGILLLSTTLLLFTSVNLSVPSTSKLSNIKSDLKDSVSQIKDKVHVPQIFKPATHAPPPPITNGTASTPGWFASWSTSWMSLFSSDSNDRVALPPIQRCSIYTYYEPSKDKTQAAIDDKMLLVWRRAWWSYGFKPMILGPAEAKQSGFYEAISRDANLTPELRYELTKWAAWNQVDGSILVDWKVIPMGPHDDSVITSLRSCKFVYTSRFKDFETKLYSSDKPSLEKILMHLTGTPQAAGSTLKTIEAALSSISAKPDELIHTEPPPSSLADYHTPYPDLKPAELPELVNAHLHSTFLSHYPDGIAVLSPYPIKFASLHHSALELATRIANCPIANPLPNSCPPNIPKCTPCTKPSQITTPPKLQDTTKIFTLGTVPHPFLTTDLTNPDISLLHDPQDRSQRFIRRKALRDPWLKSVTAYPFLANGLGEGPRAAKIKQMVASTRKGEKFLSWWQTDKIGYRDIPWTLGFEPASLEALKISLPPVDETVKRNTEAAVKMARKNGKLSRMLEKWCLGDTEVWRFVNAWRERRVMEREIWSRGERRFGVGLDQGEK